MKRVLLTFTGILWLYFCQAQQVTEFSTDHDKFMSQLEKFMTAGKMENNIKTMEDLQKMIKGNKLPAGWLDQVITVSNLMLTHRMQPEPHFYNFLNAVMNAANSGQTDAQFEAWTKFLTQVMENQKKGINSDFLKFVDFSNGFFKENALSLTPAKSWRVETNDYKFSFDSTGPVVTFPLTTLIGEVKGDSIKIEQTQGAYYPFENKWVGKGGRVTWERVGFNPNKVYCTFKDYTINLSGYSYTVDTVTFYHTDYFKKPLQGKMTDKLVSGGDSINMTYPRFESYDVGITIKNLAPDVSYTGGFSLHGSKVLGYGTADEKASLTFYARDGKTRILSARVQNLSIKKGEELGADKAEVSIYFGTDSIYHPQLTLVYKIQKREIRLLREETGLGRARFTDSYHNDEFQTDAIFWNLDSAVLNLRILSGVGKKPGVYESVNYFNKELLRKTQGIASYEPLSVLKRLCEKSNTREVSALDFAKALDPNLKEDEVKSLLFDLVANGFIGYNEDAGIITVKEKAINYVLAKAKKIDYDIITIRSKPQSGNDYIDLTNSNIDLKGVFEVPISDTAYVYFRPRDNSISLQKDRNMEFDGLMYAGRMDMIGEKFKFQYLPFTVELTKVDTMRINVPDSGKFDENGMPILKPLKSKVEGIKGLLEIDAPINKSGRTRLPQFPKLYSREKSYIYYDDSAIAKGAYGRKNFFFELEPFHLDSLNNFSPDIIAWKGRLVSGGIFPDINDSVHLQRDASLGFKGETPKGGYDLYKGKGKYYGKYELNYGGLEGNGKITHSTAAFDAHDVHLYPDSLRATSDSFFITKTFDGVKTPKVTGDSDMVFWTPGSDSMLISMRAKDKPFAMYDDTFTSFKGSLMLTGTGLRGNGTLDWDMATLTAKNFGFRTMDLNADTAALNIKTTGDKVSFKTPNVNAKVDFKTRIGDFKSNLLNIPTEFTYNQYVTAINEFKWFMDEKILDFKAPAAGPGEYFTSIRPEQHGLKFLGKRATYNLVTSVLRIEQVPEIKVADASVVPDSGVVVIEGGAKMRQLQNAVIYADTIDRAHRFDSATVDIFSKEELKAAGIYHYTAGNIKEIIDFGDISTQKETVGEKKGKHDIWQLTAKTDISKDNNFVIYPDVHFNGQASVLSVQPLVNFKGYANIDFKNPKANTSDFFINQGVDPKNFSLNFDTSTKNAAGNSISAGIHLNPVPDAPVMYTTLLGSKKDYRDITIFKTEGIVTQLPKGEYAFGDTAKIRQNVPRGNVMIYDDKKGTVNAEGKFNLGTNFGIIDYAAVGSAYVKLDSGKYKFNLTLGLNPNAGDKAEERLQFYMLNDDADQPEIDYSSDKEKKMIYELTDAKEDKKWLADFDKTAAFAKRPKNFDYNLVFNDVNFVFDPDDISLRSVGKIGVTMIGKKAINRKVDGYIEIQYKGGVDVFTIYLQTGTKGWFYFQYSPGILSALSSYDDFNKTISALAPDKRKIKGEGKRFYLYTLASALDESDFVSYMKDRAAGINRPHPQPRPVEQEEIPTAGDTSGLPPVNQLPGDTTAPAKPKEGIQQQDVNQMDQMKLNGGSILSGPPPDRIKPAAAPAKTDSMPNNAKQQQKGADAIEQLPGDNGNASPTSPPPAKTDTAQSRPIPPPPPVKQDSIPIQTVPKAIISDTTQIKPVSTPPPAAQPTPVKQDSIPVQTVPKAVISDTAQSKPVSTPLPNTPPVPVKQDNAPMQTVPKAVISDSTQSKPASPLPVNIQQVPAKQDTIQNSIAPVTPPVKQDTIQAPVPPKTQTDSTSTQPK